ncbi:hypothetical protein [Hanstruepera flava]|uniref:hypothetical protein n=1 Tax=Hanstruepera flava TaxID=2930218 RepID=UPI0020295AE6|nr:hypothetical protein [Hanstruepera flava]
MNNKKSYILLFYLLALTFGCKPKTELYLERGLDILSNKVNVNFDLYDGIIIEEVGVIRDQKEGTKTLVFKLNENTSMNDLLSKDVFLGVRVWIIGKNAQKRIENWDFKPNLIEVEGYKYILKRINIKEDQIKKMKVYLYQEKNGRKQKMGSPLILNKVNTYND